MLRKFIGNKTGPFLNHVIKLLRLHKISPNALSLTGFLTNVVAAYCYYRGLFLVGGILILVGGFFDMLDGAVARIGGISTKIGAFTDAVIDRYSDFLVFGGLLVYFLKQDDFLYTILVLAVIFGALLVSYIRARAELVIADCSVGFMERAERVFILAAGSIFNSVTIAIWILAIGTHFTALHRIYYTFKESQTSSEE